MDEDPYAPPVTREMDEPRVRKGWVGEQTLRWAGTVVVMYVFFELWLAGGMPKMSEGTLDDFLVPPGLSLVGVYGFRMGGWKWHRVIAVFMVLWISSQVYGAMQQVERESWPDLPDVRRFPGWLSFAGSLVPELMVLGCAVGLWVLGGRGVRG